MESLEEIPCAIVGEQQVENIFNYLEKSEIYIKKCLEILLKSNAADTITRCFDILRREEPVEHMVDNYYSIVNTFLGELMSEIQTPAEHSVQ